MKKIYFLIGLALLCSQVANSQEETGIIEQFKESYITPYLYLSPKEKADMFAYVKEQVYPVYQRQLKSLEGKAQLNQALNQLVQ